MIELHFVPTPNGLKIALMLEEIGLPYRVKSDEMFSGEHLTHEFRKINPNNKLPAIVDYAPDDGGEPLSVFESGAILIYLADKTGKYLATEARLRSLTLQWLIWQVAGLGPMHGQAHHFVRYAPQDQKYAVERYANEAARLLHVLEYRLGQVEYLADQYSIADIACFPWIMGAPMLGIDLAKFPRVVEWHQKIAERPAVRAMERRTELAIPEKYKQARAVLSASEWSNMFGERMHAASQANSLQSRVKGANAD
jgi:GSH-dependent disulfide-bond oxidoreductase